MARSLAGPIGLVGPQPRPLILVVEDDAAIQRLLADILEDEGYEVLTTTDGESALGLLETIEPAVVLLDIRLPGLGGYGVIDAYRGMPVPKHAPIILVSASRPTGDLPDGVVGFVRKPFDLDELVARVAEALPNAGRADGHADQPD